MKTIYLTAMTITEDKFNDDGISPYTDCHAVLAYYCEDTGDCLGYIESTDSAGQFAVGVGSTDIIGTRRECEELLFSDWIFPNLEEETSVAIVSYPTPSGNKIETFYRDDESVSCADCERSYGPDTVCTC